MTDTPGKRLINLRKSKGFKKPEDVCARTGWNVHTYKAHETGARNPKPDVAEQYAKFYGTTPEYIIFGSTASSDHQDDDSKRSFNNKNTNPALINVKDSHVPVVLSTMKIPVYGPAGAGSDDRIYHAEDYIIGWDIMPDALIGVKGAFKVLIRGSSMEERYFDGEKAEVHPYKPCIPGKDCVIVSEPDGDMLIKRYLGENATEYKVAQLNPPKTFAIKKSKTRAIYYVIGRSE
jgi:phage repressor protein C with HTH and peptisase S24 domain